MRIRVPDTRRPGFDAECRRQPKLIARAGARDA
ncbi:MAG TPA: antitoxin MazE-like protein [Rhodanobacteraceae bacterium]|nr:antitoxin MazE-like protein [Rhodanobacteraceae bacterium]